MKWEKYYQIVLDENDKRDGTLMGKKRGAIEVRLFVLLTIQNLFYDYKKLSNMGVGERKIISGFANEKYIQWNIFGSTRRLCYFKNKIIKDYLSISNSLDEIPLKGKVNKTNYFNFVKKFEKSFRGTEIKSLGLVSASRLLSMKRPDNFICLTSGNKKEVYKYLNIKSLQAKDFEGYWNRSEERRVGKECRSRWSP